MLEIPFTQIISQGNNNKMLSRFKTSDNPDILNTFRVNLGKIL